MDELLSRPHSPRHGGHALTPVQLQAKLFSGLADPKRLELLRLLVGGPRAAGDLARQAGLTPSGASNHLRCLLECGLVSVESAGRFNRYRLADVGVGGLLLGSDQLLANVGDQIEACHNYGPLSRRALRRSASRPPLPGRREAATSRRLAQLRRSPVTAPELAR